MKQLFAARSDDGLLGEYEPLYRQAKEVVGKAKSPYIAAATLETWLRSQGGFTYTVKPEQPAGPVPPLVDFVLRTKEGYCQHYAGAMAVMLRLLGMPARVAVGFTSGSYDKRTKEWVVTDYDAHAWVEVYFPEHGWLPFDPTPGRGSSGRRYSTSSLAFPSGGPTALGVAPDASCPEILRRRLKGTTGGGGGTRTPASPAAIVEATTAESASPGTSSSRSGPRSHCARLAGKRCGREARFLSRPAKGRRGLPSRPRRVSSRTSGSASRKARPRGARCLISSSHTA